MRKRLAVKNEKKKKTPRRKVKYPALKKQYNSRIRQEYIDYDYIDQLGKKELDFLNRFTEEETNANFKHGGKLINKTDKEKRACYNRNNSRNRDIYSIAKARGQVIDKEDWFVDFCVMNEDEYISEDDLIDIIDKKRQDEEDGDI
jgi:hypothetical protein